MAVTILGVARVRGLFLPLVLFASLAVACSGGGDRAGPSRAGDGADATGATVERSAAAAAPGTAEAAARGFPAPGELGLLAFIRGGNVWVKSVPDGPEVQVTFDRGYYSPRFSADGEWLAVQRNPDVVFISRVGERFSVPRGDRAGWEWSPVASQLAFMTTGEPSELHVVDPVSRSDDVVWRPDSGLAGTRIAWTPDGTRIAVGMRARQPTGPITKEQVGERGDGPGLLLIDIRTGAATELARSGFARGSLIPAEFTANGTWLVTYEGSEISASLAADGMRLSAVEITSGRVVDLDTFALLNDDAVASGPVSVAVVAGGGRMAWEQKALWTAAFPEQDDPSAGPIPAQPETAVASPAWAPPDGSRLAYVQGRAQPKPESGIPDILRTMQRRIWVHDVAAGISSPAFEDAGSREEHPQWSVDGRSLLFVRVVDDRASVWLGPPGGQPRAVVTGLVPELGSGFSGYYGSMNWSLIYDWWQPGRPVWMQP